MSSWTEERAKLEAELEQAKQIAVEYGSITSARKWTAEQYRQALSDVPRLTTAIFEGNNAHKNPSDPMEHMTLQELEELYEQEKAVYIGDDINKRGIGSGRVGAKLMRIQMFIEQKAEQPKEEETNNEIN